MKPTMVLGDFLVAYLKKIRPYVIIGCFVVGMILTPPDPMSQTLLAVPMWMLFEVGLLFSRFVRKSRDEQEDSERTDQPPAPPFNRSSQNAPPPLPVSVRYPA